MAAGLPAPPHGAVLDANDPDPPSWAALPAAQVVALITEADSGGRIGRRRTPSVPPVLLIEDRYLTGTLDLRALELPYLLEFRRCRFERGPDFRQAKLAGVEFDSCYLPGLLGRNLHTDNDLILRNCTVSAAPIDLTDGDLGGTLELSSSTLHNPDARAVHANRLTISGALLASKLTVDGELRMPGLRVGGNVNFHGSTLRNPSGFTLMIGGADIGGNLLCNSDPETRATFFSHGLIYLVSAEIHTDLVLRGAELVPKSSLDIPPPDGDPYYDAACSVLADRARVDGNVLCDIGLRCTGTLRMLNATVSGSLRLAGSSIDVSAGAEPPYPHRALHLDGCEVRGDLNARRMHILGQARLSNLSVGGSVSLEAATLHNPTQVVIEARRFVVSGNLDCREMTGTGSVQLQGARIGATVDLRDATLTETGYHTADGTPRPSLDLSTATIGRDLLCGSTQGTFRAAGGVRMHSTSIGREVNFSGALLGSDGAEQALNAFSMRCQDLVLTPAAPPVGRVDLSYVRCASLADNAQFWAAPSRIQLEDFRYQALAQPLEIGDDASVHTRLGWLFAAMNKRYAPGPYDQLASVLRASGNEEHAATVLIDKQRRRHAALAGGLRILGLPVLLWSALQRWVVGYGYRPMRALGALLVLLAIGTVCFALHGRLHEVNEQDHLLWNPFLFTVDLLVPIVDFGNKDRWQLPPGLQWLAASLTASGWILATTVAAGITRVLKRQ